MLVSSTCAARPDTAAASDRLNGLEVTVEQGPGERHGGGWEGLNAREQGPYPATRELEPADGEPSAVVADRVRAPCSASRTASRKMTAKEPAARGVASPTAPRCGWECPVLVMPEDG